jgi:hypothetical protein
MRTEEAQKLCEKNECETCPAAIPIVGGFKACRAFDFVPYKNLRHLDSKNR